MGGRERVLHRLRLWVGKQGGTVATWGTGRNRTAIPMLEGETGDKEKEDRGSVPHEPWIRRAMLGPPGKAGSQGFLLEMEK